MAKLLKGRRLFSRSILLAAPPLVIVGAVVYAYAIGGRYVTTENAYVKAEIVSISANVDGRVAQVMVRDNEAVEAGMPLFVLDPRPFEIALAASRADLANVRQRIAALRAHYRQGEMQIAAAEERIRYLEVAHTRQVNLLSEGVGTQARFDETQHDLAMARGQLNVVRETNHMVLAELGDPDAAVEDHPLYLRALADKEKAELDLSYAAVNAPRAGVLSRVTLEAGEHVETGDALFALVTTDRTWIEANFKEVQLTHVRVGQPATVTIDAYPDREWHATVESISPATGAEFAILPPQNASGNWVKVVQRIPVRLAFADGSDLALLRAGMTAAVSIDTGHERDAAAYLRSVFAQPTR
jgi:membrane fusion protein (multidrug efflux system)